MCVRTMAQTDSMRLMMAAMKKRPDSMHIAAEALNRMFDKNNSELVAQVIFRTFSVIVEKNVPESKLLRRGGS